MEHQEPMRPEDESQPGSATPAELVLRDRILSGDRDAATALLEQHLDSLYEFVFWRAGRNRPLAEDVVQDTFLIALERLAAFDGRSSLHTWLCGIAKNRLRSERRKRRPVRVEDLLAEADPEIDAILAAVDREPLPDWILEQAETQELVGATLSSLPPGYRTVLVDKYVEELSVEEIAKHRRQTSKSAESTLHRARLAFAKIFQLLAKRRGELA